MAKTEAMIPNHLSMKGTLAHLCVGLESNTIYNEDCLIGRQRLPDNSVDLIATDPPYFRVKGESSQNSTALITSRRAKQDTEQSVISYAVFCSSRYVHTLLKNLKPPV